MNKHVKKISLALLATSMVISSMPAQAGGVPVYDISNFLQAVAQVQNQVQQIKQLRSQIRAITDNGNFAGLLDNPLIRDQLNQYLPAGYTDVFQAAARGDLGALQQVVDRAIQQEKYAQSSQTGAERIAATRMLTEAQMMGMMKGLDAQSTRVQSLVNQINGTSNSAQKQDLMNTLSATQAQISIELGRMQVMMQQAEHQEKLAERQAAKELQSQRYK